MTPERWRELLRRWSAEIIAAPAYRDRLPPEVVAAGWLGYPGATEAQLADAEARLGLALPPSYRAFLTVTNGWRMTTSFIERVRPVGDIGWYRDEAAEVIEAWREGDPEVADDLGETLAISDGTHGEQIYLLNPQEVSPDGEWAAWFFAHWIPGADAHLSFWDLMQAEHESFLALL